MVSLWIALSKNVSQISSGMCYKQTMIEAFSLDDTWAWIYSRIIMSRAKYVHFLGAKKRKEKKEKQTEQNKINTQ